MNSKLLIRIIVSLGLIALAVRCAGADSTPPPSASVEPAGAATPATGATAAAAGSFQRVDGSRFIASEHFSFVPPSGWYYFGRWQSPSETQYVFSTVPEEHNSRPGQLNLVVHVLPNATPDGWIRSQVTEKQIVRKADRLVAGTEAVQVDYDQNRDPQPIEMSAGTDLLIPDGDNLVALSAFGKTWAYYLMYSGEVEDVFNSFQWEGAPPPMTQGTAAAPVTAVFATPTATPTPSGATISAARLVLDRFMQARIQRDEEDVRGLLSDRMLTMLYAGGIDVPLIQASNPCWYRYQVLSFSDAAEVKAEARVRVYEHQWPGDSAGSLPRSWEQEIGLAEPFDEWKVAHLGPAENIRQEPEEPHGPNVSACNVYSGTPEAVPSTPTPGVPTSSSEFREIGELRKAIPFPILAPRYLPESVPFSKAWLFDYADGSKTARLLYREAGNDLDATLKSVDVLLTKTGQPVTLDSVTHQFKQTAWDVHAVQVRGYAGYAYWSPGVAQGNSAVLTWREGGLNIQITLLGDWPQPTEQHPRDLDALLVKIAESLAAN